MHSFASASFSCLKNSTPVRRKLHPRLEPALTTLEPALTTLEPALTTLEPGLTKPEPALTKIEPVLTKPEPALTKLEPALTQRLRKRARPKPPSREQRVVVMRFSASQLERRSRARA